MNIKINNVRLSYPALFEAKAGPEGGEPKYSAAFLLDKKNNADAVKAMQDAILSAAKAQWGDGNVKWSEGKLAVRKADGKAAYVKTCLRDGIEKAETAGYGEGVMFFSASNKMPPAVVDKVPTIPLTKASGKPFAGCYVNAAVRLWAQDNAFGRRVNCQLQAVQFVADGEAFGDAPIDPAAVFGTVAGESFDDTSKPSGDIEEPF